MNTQRLEWKVGLFVLICLFALGAMMVKFSKGLAAFKGTYGIILTTGNIGGVQENAAVRMAGVKIGQVKSIDYDSTKMEVVLDVAVGNSYKIPANSIFTIETAGFLGEQFIAITPQPNPGAFIAPGDRVPIRQPFNLQEAARSAMHLIYNVDSTVSNLNSTLGRVDRVLLNEATLTNLAASVANIRRVSEDTIETIGNFQQLSLRAVTTMNHLDTLLQTNEPAVSGSISNILSFTTQLQAVTNLIRFSEQLANLGGDIREVVKSNRADIDATVKNFESASESLRSLTADLQAGKGLAGSLLKSPELNNQTSQLLSNLTVLSSNLNRFGLLYKPKPPKTQSTNHPANLQLPHKAIF